MRRYQREFENLRRKYTISTPLRMEKPVRRPMVPPINPIIPSRVTFRSFFGKHTMRMRCLHHHLLISLNLIIRSCVKVDVHCLQWGMLQYGGWNHFVINLEEEEQEFNLLKEKDELT